MSFVDTFGDIVGYSIYFVVGGIWLLFLAFGVCFIGAHLVSFCAGFPLWGILKDKLTESFRVSRAQIAVAASEFSKFTKRGLAKLANIPGSFLAMIKQRPGCRCEAADITMAEAGTRSSMETPLLHEHEHNFSDDETLTNSKVDVVIEPAFRTSVELQQISGHDNRS